jgi:hypothetical protein
VSLIEMFTLDDELNLESNVSLLGTAHTEVKPESIHVSFNDVRGIEEAKDDLKEV